MACSKCGSGGSVVTPSPNGANGVISNDLVLIQYVGIQTQKQRLRSKVKPNEQYIFGGGTESFYAYPGDVDWLTNMSNRFRIAEIAPTVVMNSVVMEAPTLTSEMRIPKLTDLPIDVLTLDPIVLSLLKRKFSTVNEVRNAGRAEWMTIKGIGAARADVIQEALNAL